MVSLRLQDNLTTSEEESEPLQARLKSLELENDHLRQKIELQSQENLINKENRSEAEKRLSFNPVSGLPSSYQLKHAIGGLSRSVQKKNGGFAIVIIQLDQAFAMLRKSLKANISEWLLYQIGARLTEFVVGRNRLFHSKDLEFILLIEKGNVVDYFDQVLKLISQRLGEKHIFSGFNLTIRANIGVAVFPQDARDKSKLLSRADIALGAAIEQKRQIVFFEEKLEHQVNEKINLLNALVRGIEAAAMEEMSQQFELYFQPKLRVSLDDDGQPTLQGVKAEALIRWNHPDKGLVSPMRFIPLAEETGLILPMDKWVLYQGIAALRRWRDLDGFEGLSINISAGQFQSGDMVDLIEAILKQETWLKGKLTIELTETGLFEQAELAQSMVKRFRALGVKISLDDFGTGFSSLSHLHKFRLDEIKIDQSFIRDFPENEADRAIVDSLVQMARDLSMEIVAEGVERKEQVLPLMQRGCTNLQGFLFAPPLPEKAFLDFLEHHKKGQAILSL